MTSTVSSSALSLPSPQVMRSTSPSRVRNVSSPAPPSSASPAVSTSPLGPGWTSLRASAHSVSLPSPPYDRVHAEVGEDRVVAVAAVLDVVAGAAGHHGRCRSRRRRCRCRDRRRCGRASRRRSACRCPPPPKMRSKDVRSPVPLASPVTMSSPRPPLSQSLPCTPQMVSLPRPPKTRSLPGPPMRRRRRRRSRGCGRCRRCRRCVGGAACRAGARCPGRPGWSPRRRFRRAAASAAASADDGLANVHGGLVSSCRLAVPTRTPYDRRPRACAVALRDLSRSMRRS